MFNYIIFDDSQPSLKDEDMISNSLSHYLCDIKERITTHIKEWDTYKKYTNPYEYIHSIIPHKKRSVSKYKPISRSYFKMIEMMQLFDFFPDKNQPSKKYFHRNVQHPPGLPPNDHIQTFHLAEGPGGFIQAFARYRQNPKDTYIGITLLDENDVNIPSWKKSATFLKENPNIILENGIDGTGNILSIDNFKGCLTKYGEGSMDFITGDGGFDFSMDFNNQEVYITKLLFAQIAYAICLQKEGGTFVLKLFDIFMKHTIDIIAILSSFYDKVYITKLLTSRYANSEKYLVCIGFSPPPITTFREKFTQCFSQMVAHKSDYVHRFLSVPIPYFFIQKIEEYNAIFGQKQIQNIHYTISLMNNKYKQDKIDELIKANIQKSIEWCIKYKVAYHTISTSNIFLGNTSSDNLDI